MGGCALQAARRGQAIVESLFVLLVLLAGFFFFYDFVYGAVASFLLQNGAARVARAATVGFSDFHQEKALHVGVIPVSGPRTVPQKGVEVPSGDGELIFVREYLRTEDRIEAINTLDYERWALLEHSVAYRGPKLEVSASFGVPWLMSRQFGALFGQVPRSQTHWLRAEWTMEDHASYYLTRESVE